MNFWWKRECKLGEEKDDNSKIILTINSIYSGSLYKIMFCAGGNENEKSITSDVIGNQYK